MNTYYIRLMLFGVIGSCWGCFCNFKKPGDKEFERRLKLNIPFFGCLYSVLWTEVTDNHALDSDGKKPPQVS